MSLIVIISCIEFTSLLFSCWKWLDFSRSKDTWKVKYGRGRNMIIQLHFLHLFLKERQMSKSLIFTYRRKAGDNKLRILIEIKCLPLGKCLEFELFQAVFLFVIYQFLSFSQISKMIITWIEDKIFYHFTSLDFLM